MSDDKSLDHATIEACMREIDRWIMRGPLLAQWAHDQRNGMILAYNLLHQMLHSKEQAA